MPFFPWSKSGYWYAGTAVRLEAGDTPIEQWKWQFWLIFFPWALFCDRLLVPERISRVELVVLICDSPMGIIPISASTLLCF